MRVEEIAVRQEVRQMLSEAGINQNTLKEMVKDVLTESIEKAVRQALNERDTEGVITSKIENCINNSASRVVREEIRQKVNSIFHNMTVTVDITDKTGQFVTTHN